MQRPNLGQSTQGLKVDGLSEGQSIAETRRRRTANAPRRCPREHL